MGDNTQLNRGQHGDNIRTVEKNAIKTQSIVIDVGGDGSEDFLTASRALPTIEQEHNQIHLGQMFSGTHKVTVSDGGGTYKMLAIVDSAQTAHFRGIAVQSDGGPFNVDLYESPTVTDNGTALTAYNNNRNSSTTPTLATYYGSTTSANGNLLEGFLVPGTRGVAGREVSEEWILKLSTTYLILITNNTSGAGTSDFVITFMWYEP